MQGNKRFLEGDTLHRNIQADIEFTQNQQHPIGIVLGCIDSRVPVETIFDMSLGDLFCARIAGNVVNEGIIGSMEYACKVAGAKLIVVLGHLQCGAVKSACDSVELGNITNILKQINNAIQAETNTQEDRNSTNSTFVENVTHLNIANTMIEIYLKSSIIKEMVDNEEICIVGANYDVATGKVTFSDYLTSIDKLVKNAQTPIASIDSLITSIKNIPILN
jgi:carbonic anhydrase